MNRDRAAEIIAAYGGDPARWPAAERAAALQLTLDDRALGVVRRDALALDAVLTAWATSDAVAGDAAQAAARVLAGPLATRLPRRRRPVVWWTAGTAVAAAGALAIALISPALAPRAAPPVVVSDDAALAMLFTPMNGEDGSI